MKKLSSKEKQHVIMLLISGNTILFATKNEQRSQKKQNINLNII